MRKICVFVGLVLLLMLACDSLTSTDELRTVSAEFQTIDVPIITSLE